MTWAASELEILLDRRWPSLRFEAVNCRKIAGTLVWSQHSWPGGNARDIFGPDKLPSSSSQALLDVVAAYLKANRGLFGIRTILWRMPDHYNHVHADMWPTGYGIPPCAGGRERYQYSDGRILRATGGIVKPEGTFEEVTVLIKPGETGPYVQVYQQALNGWAVKQAVPNWTRLVEDGSYGPNTLAAVRQYQTAAGIGGKVPELGALDDLTRDLLERFVES